MIEFADGIGMFPITLPRAIVCATDIKNSFPLNYWWCICRSEYPQNRGISETGCSSAAVVVCSDAFYYNRTAVGIT
jgi:hypothetical protein